MQKILIARQADLVRAAERAFATHLRRDKEFARRYPTLEIRPGRIGHEVGLRVGTRRTRSKAEPNWPEIGAFLKLDQGVIPPGGRRAAALWATHDVLTTVLIPNLLSILPNITRNDVVALIRDAWPATRGTGSNAMFDPQLVRAAYRALAREHPDWGARALYAELAAELNVVARTVASLVRKK